MPATIQGSKQLEKALKDLDKKVRQKLIKKALRDGGKVMAKQVKSNAPEDTGRLKKSVKVRAGKRKKNVISVAVVISGGHETAFVASVEYGNEDTRAQPFIRPAFNATSGPVGEKMVADLKSGIESLGS